MKIDAPLLGVPLSAAADLAARHVAAGFDGVFTFDGPSEPFTPLAMVAARCDCDIATGVAIAFARTPMTVAQTAHDLQMLSGGRFFLGIGSQIRAHVEHRFSMPWGKPIARMKEFVLALRAIFACWNDDVPLRFEGEFYSHTLMPPLLRPPACPYGPPPIFVAGVGPAMIRAAGEVADGLVVHPFHSPAYLAGVARPALEVGLAGRADRGRFAIVCQTLVATGETDAEHLAAREAVRAQIAFYASTPAYRPVLEAEGLGDLQAELRRLTKQGRWDAMADLVGDDVVARFAVSAPPREAGRELARRYRGFASRIALATPMLLSTAASQALVEGLREGCEDQTT